MICSITTRLRSIKKKLKAFVRHFTKQIACWMENIHYSINTHFCIIIFHLVCYDLIIHNNYSFLILISHLAVHYVIYDFILMKYVSQYLIFNNMDVIIILITYVSYRNLKWSYYYCQWKTVLIKTLKLVNWYCLLIIWLVIW